MPAFLDKLLGRKKPVPPAPAPPVPPAADPRDEEPIVCYDEFGRELQVKRGAWRTEVLPAQLRRSWNDPDALAGDIFMALRDGFAREVVSAAQHLHDIDPNHERGASLRAGALMESGDLDGAQRVLARALGELPHSATLHSNLALLHSRRGDTTRARSVAWATLQLDPNVHTALALFASTSDDQAAAARAVFALPGSWLAGLWVAVDHLTRGDVPAAVAIYEKLLDAFPEEGELLVNISGDLGRHGQLDEATRLVLPRYEPRAGELTAGFNLLQVLLELRDRKRGEELLHRMQLAAQPPERERLMWYSNQFSELDAVPSLPVPATDVSIEMMQLDHPVWTNGAGDLSWLLPQKSPDARQFAIFAFSYKRPDSLLREDEALAGREDDLGRASRAMPLHLGDTIRFRTDARATLYMPVASDGGMVVLGAPADHEWVEALTRDESHAITGSINVIGDGEIELHIDLWERGTAKPIAHFDERGPVDALPSMYARTERELLRFLQETNVVAARNADPRFLVPDEQLRNHLMALGQIYAVAIARVKSGKGLFGERNIHRWVLNGALAMPESSLLRIAMVSVLANGRRLGSKVYLEIENETLKLFERVTRDDPAYLVTPALFRLFELDKQFHRRRNELLGGASEEYVKWLADLETLFE
jgi:tetratricopeptide (TPR) repeat protein